MSESVPNTFCVYPFSHLNIDPDGRARLCCHTNEHVRSGNRPMRLGSDSFEEIWNSAYLQAIRLKMVEGRPVAACLRCAHLESIGGESLRIHANRRAQDITGLTSLEAVHGWAREEAARHHGRLAAPSSLQLWMGNVCNAKCRMCSAALSSLIGADPVHSAWAGLDRTKTILTELIPEAHGGSTYHGYGPVQLVDGFRGRSVHANGGTVRFVSEDPLTEVYISGWLRGTGRQTLHVDVDGQRVFSADVGAGSWQEIIRFARRDAREGVTIAVRPGVGLGEFAVSHLVARTHGTVDDADEKRHVSRLPQGLAWTGDGGKTLAEILASPARIREIYLAGGEPLVNPYTTTLLETLTREGRPDLIGVFVHTNGTVFSRRICALLRQFRWAVLAISLDGVGKVLRYIRHPGHWEQIARNVLAYRDEGVHVTVQPCIQAYNAVDAIDVVRFCQQHQVSFQLSNVLIGPRYLSIEMLPASVCERAAALWQDYRDRECPEGSIKEVEALLAALRRPRPSDRAELEREFVRFTRDLDRDRKESLEASIPKLYSALVDAGVDFGREEAQ